LLAIEPITVVVDRITLFLEYRRDGWIPIITVASTGRDAVTIEIATGHNPSAIALTQTTTRAIHEAGDNEQVIVAITIKVAPPPHREVTGAVRLLTTGGGEHRDKRWHIKICPQAGVNISKQPYPGILFIANTQPDGGPTAHHGARTRQA